MSLNREVYINNHQLNKLATKFDLYIFGAGKDGEWLLSQIEHREKIIAFVDNKKFGQKVGDYPIICVDELLKQKKDTIKTIISTSKYAQEIALQLQELGFIEEKDYYVWDDSCLYHIDEDVAAMISFNKKVWGEAKETAKKSQIIIPYENYHDVSSVVLAYCSQYLADKYDADVYCYPRPWGECGQESAWKVYQSFHAKKVLKPILSQQRDEEADKIAEDVWNGIQKMEDWKDISIFGITFGTTFIRDYLRHYIPYINPKDVRLKQWFVDAVKRIVYWYDYIESHDVKALIMWDGVHREGYLRDIAIAKGIPTYGLHYTDLRKLSVDYTPCEPYEYFKKFWDELSEEEQEYGIKWSKKHLEERFRGGTAETPYMKGNSPYALGLQKPVLEKNDKFKIMICAHCFDDDAFFCGEQIFDNNMFEWLCHLGELSEKTPEYDWYLKFHPNFCERDIEIVNMVMDEYPTLKPIREKVSPMQLKEEGIRVAITLAGTVGHEYPLLGIPVINSGKNPHMAFDFNWNPKTKEEFDDLIYNLKDAKKDFDVEEIYQYYCLNYLYYDWSRYSSAKNFFINPDLSIERDSFEKTGRNLGAWKYPLFIREWTPERHEEIKQNVVEIFEYLDEWRADRFYRREIEREEI